VKAWKEATLKRPHPLCNYQGVMIRTDLPLRVLSGDAALMRYTVRDGNSDQCAFARLTLNVDLPAEKIGELFDDIQA
jgi:hypothetical protein